MTELRHKTLPGQQPLPLDLETAPDTPPQPLGYRWFVGGFLAIEGLVTLSIGLSFLIGFWPPFSTGAAHRPHPISQIGLWITVLALIYMVVVGVSMALYNRRNPFGPHDQPPHHPDDAVGRMRRYAAMKNRTYYIFDNSICNDEDAENANRARDLY